MVFIGSEKNMTTWDWKQSVWAPTKLYAPTYSPTSLFAPTTSIQYPNFALQIQSPMASVDQTQRSQQEPNIRQEPTTNPSFSQSPTTSPQFTAQPSQSSGLNPIWLVAGAVVLIGAFMFLKK